MKERLDILLVDRHLVESRTKAQWLIKNGYVSINGVKVRKPGKRIDNTHEIILKSEFPYVGRGGLKLEKAIKDFSISVKGKVCADIGASVGGFTDCLLFHGASKVYAIDIATEILHPSLMCEDRVIKMLGIDARTLKNLDEIVDIFTIDVTFTSLKSILPNLKNFLKKDGDIIALIKPLFETKFHGIKKFKIINDADELKNILLELIKWSEKNGLFPYGLIKSPILGKGGSIEFLIHFKIENKSLYFNYEKIVDII